jgi:deoxyribodipyrimidine photolyase
MPPLNFEPKTHEELLEYCTTIDPRDYERSRNSLNGKVTMLSPYITAGIISLSEIKSVVLQKHDMRNSLKLIQELAWRDYFKSVQSILGDKIFQSIKSEQAFAEFDEIPTSILEAKTGIEVIDNAVTKLYKTGYLHNHERMWLAMLICNIAGTNWKTGAKWMYYHLIDGDLASNSLSWQWVAGTFSSKKYFANQENLNKYGNSQDRQSGTIIDKSYEELSQYSDLKIAPLIFDDRSQVNLENNTEYLTSFFEKADRNDNQNTYFTINTISNELILETSPVLVYIEDPNWLISKNRIDFVVSQIKLIAPNTKLLVLKKNDESTQDLIDSLPIQPRLFPTLTYYYSSFFKFWSYAEKLVYSV